MFIDALICIRSECASASLQIRMKKNVQRHLLDEVLWKIESVEVNANAHHTFQIFRFWNRIYYFTYTSHKLNIGLSQLNRFDI